jgi:hypothetical protein
MSELAVTDEERAVLDLVERQGGRANWHSVANRIGPTQESTVTHLRELTRRKLTCEVPGGQTMQRYAITEVGRAALHGREACDALRLFAEACDAGPVLLIELFMDVMVDQANFAARLERVRVELPERRRAVARGLQILPGGEARAAIARRMFDDDAAVLLAEWCPPRLHFLGEHEALLPADDWDALLARGFAHAAAETRRDAAALAYATDRGARFVRELLALAAGGEYAAVLALAGASDPESLAALEALLAGADAGRAATAARALGERPDGEAAFTRARADERSEVRNAASFAASVRGRGRRAPR